MEFKQALRMKRYQVQAKLAIMTFTQAYWVALKMKIVARISYIGSYDFNTRLLHNFISKDTLNTSNIDNNEFNHFNLTH